MRALYKCLQKQHKRWLIKIWISSAPARPVEGDLRHSLKALRTAHIMSECCKIWMLKDWEQVPAGLKGGAQAFLIDGNLICSNHSKQVSKCFISTLYWCFELSATPAMAEAQHKHCYPVQGHILVIQNTGTALLLTQDPKSQHQVFIKGKSITFKTMNSHHFALKL